MMLSRGRAARLFSLLAGAALAAPVACLTAGVAGAQESPAHPTPNPAPALHPVPSGASSPPQAYSDARLDVIRERLRGSPWNVELPPTSEIVRGDRRIGAGERHEGSLAVAGGTLEVHGLIEGDAISIGGEVVVREGGEVRGDAVAAGGGRVRLEGGVVAGQMLVVGSEELGGAVARPEGRRARAATGDRASRRPSLSVGATTRRAVSVAFGGLVMLSLIGMGVLIFAGDLLGGVVTALQRQFGRAFVIGVAGQLAIVPVLIVGSVALAATVIGLLVIPVFAFLYVLAIAGALTLGLLAVARLTGGALVGPAGPGLAAERRAALRALMVGITLFAGLWILAAAFTFQPVLGGAFRGLAAMVTWVALTAGLGATLITRMGTRRGARAAPPPSTVLDDELAWATPTPVTGIAAARRPGTPLRTGDRL